MISDELCHANWDILDYQAISPDSYGAAAKEVDIVLAVMDTLEGYLEIPPAPLKSLPDYFEKHDAIREAVRCLDVSVIAIAMRDFKSVGKRRRPSYLGKGAVVLGRCVERIRRYQQPPRGDCYKFLTEEIEVVVTVMTALRLYLDALALPIPKNEEKVKALGESLRRLDLDRCRRSMKEFYDYIGTV
jgi:hypothetical protein